MATIACSKDFEIVIADNCFIDAQLGELFSYMLVTLTGTGFARSVPAANNLWVSRSLSLVLTPDDDGAVVVTKDGGLFGTASAANRYWYLPFGGAAVEFGPAAGHQNTGGGKSEDGLFSFNYNDGLFIKMDVYKPGVGVVASFGGAGAASTARFNSSSPGRNGHVIYELEAGGLEDWFIWHQDTGSINMGLPSTNSNFEDIGPTGHAVVNHGAGAPYPVYFWNGVTSTLVASPASGAVISRINANDIIVGTVTSQAFFWKWDAVNGYVTFGLPPGAAAGSNIWITDDDLIVVNADNGVWYYDLDLSAWGTFDSLMGSPAGWTAYYFLFDVSADGYACGMGVHLGVDPTPFWCKFCAI